MAGHISGGTQAVRRVAGRAALVLTLVFLVVLGIGPLTNRYRVATVLSGSMAPTFSAGAVVLSTPVAAEDVEAGDVITFHTPTGDRHLATHRVVEVVESGRHPVVRTRGDANGADDPWLARLDGSGPVWRARVAIPKLGFVIHGLRQPLVHRLLVLVAPTLFLIVSLAVIWRRPAAETGTPRGAGV